MKKNVWIINHHANNTFFDNGGRHYCFAKYLKRLGYNPVVFCANAVHGNGQVYFDCKNLYEVHVNESIDVPYVFVKSRPYNSNGKDRILGMLDFYFNVKLAAKKYASQYGLPDIIIGSSVHPLAVFAAEKLAKHFNVRCIAEIRDLWPESLVAYGILSSNNFITKILRRLEKHLYICADDVIFTMEDGYGYITEQHWESDIPREKVHYINNGVDIESFDQNVINNQLVDSDLLNENTFKVIYTGSIRSANNVGLLLDIAKQVPPQIQFLIWGTGNQLDDLIARVKNENIGNVIFKGYVEKKYIPFIVSQANVNIMDMQNSNDIFRFGISPNKLFDYIAAEKAILMYQLYWFNPVEKYKIGYVADSVDDISSFLNLYSKGQINYAVDGFRTAREEFSYEKLTKKLINIIEASD